ncbi:hypothetical protein RC1_4116 [Rhodospirillum centenum SW]|uniref:Uncharacterized protein n=1 Tax=Rhodospirillum centenum (strain ATCC 51521 / SW) TaxID=414684 RepID=B6IYT1_RHOCS|nr:hypothetical protein RC1_4116 [Rhodospirillum centenum SW]
MRPKGGAGATRAATRRRSFFPPPPAGGCGYHPRWPLRAMNPKIRAIRYCR